MYLQCTKDYVHGGRKILKVQKYSSEDILLPFSMEILGKLLIVKFQNPNLKTSSPFSQLLIIIFYYRKRWQGTTGK